MVKIDLNDLDKFFEKGELIPAICYGFADNASRFGIRHPAVNDINALVVCILYQFNRFFFGMAFEPFTAETYFTYH